MSNTPHPPRVQNPRPLAADPLLKDTSTVDLARELAYRLSPDRYKYETLETVDELADVQGTINTGITVLAIARAAQSVSGRLTPRLTAVEAELALYKAAYPDFTLLPPDQG